MRMPRRAHPLVSAVPSPQDSPISGIRPQIAQTMVHLGVEFGDVVTKASLADALKYAFQQAGITVT